MKKLITLVHQLITKSSHQLILTLANLVIITSVFAQAPEKMSYQAVIRDGDGNLVANQSIGMRISILQATVSGTVVYQEIYNPNPQTNANGLVTVEIGGGVPVTGTFAGINWSNGPFFIKTETDISGGTTYTIIGTSQILSVAYALHAKTAESISGGITETDPVYDLSVASGITSVDTSNWNASYNWGNHASAGYLTSFNETDPVFGVSVAGGITSVDTSNWNASYNWGNHASAGYLTAESQNISNVLTQGNNAGNLELLNISRQGIGTATPNASAALEVSSTTQGFLPPRMTTAQANTISNPATGLIIFNTTTSKMQFYNGTVWVNMDGSFTCGNSTISDYDGNVYNTVKIGNQCWMKENLKTTHYANGTALVDGTSAGNITGNYTTKYWFVYGNSLANKDIYGLLYTWAAAMNGAASSTANPSGIQGVCPSGWHLPSDAEWTQLTNFLGGESVAGGKMKETGTSHWSSPNTGATNESGFTALPGGIRSGYGTFSDVGYNGYWWSATEYDAASAWKRNLYCSYSNVTSIDGSKGNGFSVRCVRD